MGVESPVTGQDFASSFFARLGQRMRKLNTILTGKRKKNKTHSFIPEKYTKYCVRTWYLKGLFQPEQLYGFKRG